MSDEPQSFPPVETTGDLVPGVKAGTFGVLVAPGRIYVGGEGTFDTTAFRMLDGAEVKQLTYILPNLFTDMAEEYRRLASPPAPLRSHREESDQ